MPKVVMKSGPDGHTAPHRFVPWHVSGASGLSTDYMFEPGVPVEVTDADAAFLANPKRTRGRRFERVGGSGSAVSTATTESASEPQERASVTGDSEAKAGSGGGAAPSGKAGAGTGRATTPPAAAGASQEG